MAGTSIYLGDGKLLEMNLTPILYGLDKKCLLDG